jgi:NADH dehydrogenase (ubiquinone) flavoprotein 2
MLTRLWILTPPGPCCTPPATTSADYTNGVEGFSYNYYEDLTTTDVKGIVDTLRKGGKLKVR